jgi:ATP synthase protein I
MPSDQDQSSKKKPRLTNYYARYSAMGAQMLAIIGIGTYSGIKLDEWLELDKTPVFTILFALLSVIFAIYFVVKDLLKK